MAHNSTAAPAIAVSNLTKYYGNTRGIHQLSISASHGEIFGLLGQNGSGKTTLIRLLMNFIKPDSGSASVLGTSPFNNSVQLHRSIGYLPAPFAAYANLTGQQIINYFSALRNAKPHLAEQLVKRFDFNPKRKVKHLSHGNRQKLGIIQAFMHDPPLVILDEPTTGLDPFMQTEFLAVARESAQRGNCVFLSSHDLYEAQAACRRIAIVRNGQVIKTAEVEHLQSTAANSIQVRFLQPVSASAFKDIPNLTDISVQANTLTGRITGSMDAFTKRIAQFKVDTFTSRAPSIEEAFMHYYQMDPDASQDQHTPTDHVPTP